VGRLGLIIVSRSMQRSPQLKVREGADGIAANDPPVIENLLKLRGGFAALLRVQISLAAHVHRIESSKFSNKPAEWHPHLIRDGNFQQLDGPCGLAAVHTLVQGKTRAEYRKVTGLDAGILGKAPG